MVVISTVNLRAAEDVVKLIIGKESDKKAFRDFGLAMNPEFLIGGNIDHDYPNPDRIVMEVKDGDRGSLETLYKPFSCPKLITNIKTAEMIKHYYEKIMR